MKKIVLFSALLLTLTGCNVLSHDNKDVAADRIGRPAFMVDRMLKTEMFEIKAWERMHKRFAPATIYIEGDGKHWEKDVDIAHRWFDEGNTPANPVGLHLASRDLSENLGYLARPCQYIYNPEEKGCSSLYWGSRRYSRDVVNSYHEALNEMKARYNLTDIHLVGFDGGAVIAAYLAAERDDIKSLRTVAGVLNHSFITSERGLDPLSGSLNPIEIAPQLAKVPQIHFIGGADEMVTPGVYHSFRQAMGTSDCIHYSMVQDASHYLGWVDKWPDLLNIQPSCRYGDPADFDASAHRAMHNKGMKKGYSK